MLSRTVAVHITIRHLIPPTNISEIQFTIGIGLKAPIAEGAYKVGSSNIEVSYPSVVNLGMGPELLPIGLSTVFLVKWADSKNQDAKDLMSQTHHRHLTIHKALDAINELLQAYKLVRMGHIDSCGVRSVGIYDTLFYFSSIDGASTQNLNVGWKGTRFQSHGASPHDPFGTTALATPHIATATTMLTFSVGAMFAVTNCLNMAFTLRLSSLLSR